MTEKGAFDYPLLRMIIKGCDGKEGLVVIVRQMGVLFLFGSFVGGLLLSACSPNPTSVLPTVQGPEIRAMEVRGEMTFAPGNVTFTVGQSVRITFINEGTVGHEIHFAGLVAEDVVVDWFGAGRVPQEKIDEINQLAAQGQVAAYAAPGGSVRVEFTPTSTGSFEYRCLLPGHEEMGTGELVVR